MSEMTAKFKVTATAEIRDKDGNLISSTPVEFNDLTTEELDALGFPRPTTATEEK
jgi:hypothetical protein